jgi:hypothetical protein
VKQFVVLGERNSGTNYVSQLMKANLEGSCIEYLHEFPKHWTLSGLNVSLPAHTLIVMVTRNPWDWLKSMHSNCYCCEQMQAYPFTDFLNQPYTITSKPQGHICPAYEPTLPDGSPLPNMMSLRTARLRMHLNLGRAFHPWFVTLRLEDLWCADNPAALMQSLMSRFCLTWKLSTSQVGMDAREWLQRNFSRSQKIADSWFFNSREHCLANSETSTQLSVINRWLRESVEQYIGYPMISC